MLDEFPQAYYYVQATMLLYAIQIVFHWWGMYFTSSSNIRKQQFVNIFLFLVGVAVTAFGIHFLWTDEWLRLVMHHKDLQENSRKNGKYDEISKAINWLIWLRLWVILFIGTFFACMGLYILAIMLTGRRSQISQIS